jgi:hypothetical protein
MSAACEIYYYDIFALFLIQGGHLRASWKYFGWSGEGNTDQSCHPATHIFRLIRQMIGHQTLKITTKAYLDQSRCWKCSPLLCIHSWHLCRKLSLMISISGILWQLFLTFLNPWLAVHCVWGIFKEAVKAQHQFHPVSLQWAPRILVQFLFCTIISLAIIYLQFNE